MSSVGHLVSKFQVTEGDESAPKKAKGNLPQSSQPPGEDETPAEPPGGDRGNRSKPAPPGKKPSKLPSSVSLRKQASAQEEPRRAAGAGARQSSVSFTTEDLDLFQRRPSFTEPQPPAEKPAIRRSRKDAQDSNSEKRRSRSVGAPAFGGLRPMPSSDKPKVASKPSVAEKPTTAKKPSSLPRPFQNRTTDTSDEPQETRRFSGGNRNKSYRTAVRSPTRSRPSSGSRSRSGSASKSKKATESSKTLTSPASSVSPTSPASAIEPAISRSRPTSGSGSRLPTGASSSSRPRPFGGSRPPRAATAQVHKANQNLTSQLNNEQNLQKEVSVSATSKINQTPEHGQDQVAFDSGLKKKPFVNGSFIPVPQTHPKIPPKISPKPKSPHPSPKGSPILLRALKILPQGSSDDEIKAAAKANILSALARRSGILENNTLSKSADIKDLPAKAAEAGHVDKSSEQVGAGNICNEERVSVIVEGATVTETTDALSPADKPTNPSIERLSFSIEGVTATESDDASEGVINTVRKQAESSNFKKETEKKSSPIVTKKQEPKRELDLALAQANKVSNEAEESFSNKLTDVLKKQRSFSTDSQKDETKHDDKFPAHKVHEQSPNQQQKSPEQLIKKSENAGLVEKGSSPGGSPALKTKKPVLKPTSPPPLPPPTKSDLSSHEGSPVASPKASDLNRNISETQVPKKPCPLVPPKPKHGLSSSGVDIPISKLTIEDNVSNSSLSSENILNKPQRTLPLAVFSQDKNGAPYDSNDADDEDELANAASQKQRVYVKSFSVEQKDLKPSPENINRGRPSSAISGESDSSSGEAQKEKSKNKKGVFERLRKLTIGGTPVEELDDEHRQVGDATFYHKDSPPGSTKEGELHHNVGKATFYSSDSKTNEESNQSHDETPKRTASCADRASKVSLRHNGSGRKLSNKSFRSGIFVDNEVYDAENGLNAYENVFFGSLGTNTNDKNRRNILNSSSLESVEDKPESHDMEVVGSGDQAQPMGGKTEAKGDIAEDSTDEDPRFHIYDNAVPLSNNNEIYSNVSYGGYHNRSVWRRRTIKRRTAKKPTNENETEEGGQTTEDFEDFSNSDDSFDSDTFTDDSEEEKDKLEPTYVSVQGEPPPKEEPVPKAVKLKRIATELLTTERAFVKRLHLIDQVFHFKIVIENRSHHMFPDDVIPQMFSNIKSIYQFHNDFLLPQLEKRMADWDQTPKIGDLMRKFAPFLKLYSEYVKNFDHAVNTINSWQQRSHMFANIITELQKKPECGMLTLQHHMLEPIQRVPRYKLLLEDYLKNLPEDVEDKPDTEKALELVTTAAAHANETMWKIEKFRKLLELNEMFGGVVDLIDPSRELLKEGKIYKISARNGVLYDRYLFLFTDMLLLCTNNRMGLTRSYHINNVLKLNGTQVLEGDNLETPFTFYVKTKTKTIELHSSTREEMNEWYSAIENVIADYKKRQMSRLAGLKSTEDDEQLGYCAPTWVKDQNTSMCMLCGTAFTMLKRRHHCRCCGIVVCARCSSHKAPLPYQNNKPDRVCDNCYKTLSGRKENFDRSNNSRVKGVLQVKGSDPSVVSGMMQLSSDKKIWERRWFALHENFVLYTFKAPQDVHAMTSMPLPGYTVCEATKDDHIDKDRVIKLYHAGTKKVYFFHVDNDANFTKWLTGLQYAVKIELPPDYEPPAKKDSKD